MNQTKDEITINITKKAKIWLSVILCTILAVIATVVLVVRHNSISSHKSATPTDQSSSSGSGGGSAPAIDPSLLIDDSVDLENSNLTQILRILDDVGDIYHTWFGKYFDDARVVDKTKAVLTPSRFQQLESHAEYMMQVVERDYYSVGKIVTIDTVFDSADFEHATTTLKNLLNEAE